MDRATVLVLDQIFVGSQDGAARRGARRCDRHLLCRLVVSIAQVRHEYRKAVGVESPTPKSLSGFSWTKDRPDAAVNSRCPGSSRCSASPAHPFSWPSSEPLRPRAVGERPDPVLVRGRTGPPRRSPTHRGGRTRRVIQGRYSEEKEVTMTGETESIGQIVAVRRRRCPREAAMSSRRACVRLQRVVEQAQYCASTL